MPRARVNPFDQGTAERVLFDRYRKADASARVAERARDQATVDAEAHRAAADRYAEALRALGHGDKVPGQAALPAPGRVR
jgi:hypothetical protein